MKTLILLTILSVAFNTPIIAQEHEHHQHEEMKDSSKPASAMPMDMKNMENMHAKPDTLPHSKSMQHDMHGAANKLHDHTGMSNQDHMSMNMDMSMSNAYSRNLPMTRNGSGTAWLPDNSPMYGYMFHAKKWMYMLHGDAYIRYNKQDLFDKGNRGEAKFDAPNMVMLMGQRNIGKNGLLHFNTMFSLDPLTIGDAGYPLLFQTGESYHDKPLVDQQHPHDLFSELSISYSHAFTPKSDMFLYVGYPGEPALGPAAFVHRPSGFFNPDAPLTHHWVDATHITFGVATLGYRYGDFKIEGSSFTGREPGENRYNFDKPRFDSWSGRLSYNPTSSWALQVSHGFIKQPELIHLNENVNRTTASATYSGRGFGEQFVNVTALWGMNKTKGYDAENGVLLEGAYNIKKTAVYSRYEWVQKSAEELNLDETLFGTKTFSVHAFTAGVSYDILNVGKTKFALGGQLSIYKPEDRLSKLYGDNPMAGQIYLRIYPKAMGRSAGSLYLPY